jgi:hypothetical protein
MRSHKFGTGQKLTPAKVLPTTVYEETKEPSDNNDQNETIKNIPKPPPELPYELPTKLDLA